MTTLVLLLFFGALIGTVFYRLARYHRARDDHRTLKRGVPSARKNKWSRFWAMVRAGAVLSVLALALVSWAGREARESVSDQPSSPATATTRPR